MHRPEYINIINEAAAKLHVDITHFSDNWAIKISKGQATKFIVGYTFPLNNSACYKIARNKNLCSEILTSKGIANVPHYLLYSPTVMKRRNSFRGNGEAIQNFIEKHGYPFVIKKNNSSRGDGVYLINNEPEMEDILSKVYTTDSTLCFSPYRRDIREYRNVVLKGKCLLSYEKQRPFVVGDGKRTVLELLIEYQQQHLPAGYNKGSLMDESLIKDLNVIPGQNDKVFLHWRHNNNFGVSYQLVEDTKELEELAVTAANAIDANFVSVDIVYSKEFAFEVMEVNASVVIHMFAGQSKQNYSKAVDVFTVALNNVFKISE